MARYSFMRWYHTTISTSNSEGPQTGFSRECLQKALHVVHPRLPWPPGQPARLARYQQCKVRNGRPASWQQVTSYYTARLWSIGLGPIGIWLNRMSGWFHGFCLQLWGHVHQFMRETVQPSPALTCKSEQIKLNLHIYVEINTIKLHAHV